MKRCVIATQQPWGWIDQFPNHSIMIINPGAPRARYNYLLEHSDYSLLVTDGGISERNGGDYADERVFWYTSGTTGDSKFYGFSQHQLDTMSHTICNAYALTANDRYYGVMPLWHAHGQGFYWAVKRAGCESRFGSIKDRKQIESFQPTFFTAIPDMTKIIGKWHLKSLRFLRTASAALPYTQYHALRQRFLIPIVEAFGMTEALSHCFTNPLHGEQRVGTVGLASGVEARIDGGRLLIKGSCVYHRDWFDTGDLAEQDEKGYYKILGRSQDQINVRGIKINPSSIENQLYEHFPSLQSCVVFGTSCLKCVYVGNVQQKDIASWLSSLGNHCRPCVLQQLDAVPTNSAGKISRTMLESLYPGSR